MQKSLRRKNEDDRKYLWVLLVFLVFEYVRVQDSYIPFISAFKIPIILNIFLLFVVISRKRLIPRDAAIYLIFVFLAQMVVSVPFAVNNFHAFNTTQAIFLTTIVVLSTIVLINDSKALLKLFKVLVVIECLVALWVLKTGGVGPGGFVYDENDACLLLVVGLPFIWYYYKLGGLSVLMRLTLLVAICLVIVAIVLTSSRGGFLGAIAVLGTLFLISKHPMRNITMALVLSTVLGGALIQLAPETYVDDMKTITDKENSTRNLRFLHWTTAWEIYKDNPVLGVGPQNYPWVSGDYFHLSPYFVEGSRGRSGRQSHSLYFTLIPEMGSVGIVIFFSLCVIFFKRLLRIRRSFLWRSKSRNELGASEELVVYNFSSALIASMAGFLVAGAFISVLYYPIFWNLLGFMIATWNLSDESNVKDKKGLGVPRK